MNSRQFVLFLETLTGIENLLPDPYFTGGGVHISGEGDFLKIHADFNWHHKLQAYRRVNALLYLSDDWQPEWEGAIEFWDREMTGAVDRALPIFNRLVVFSTGEHSNHGQREPNRCPPDVYRKVLNLYYYTTARHDQDMDDPHFTLYKQSASEFAQQLGDDYRATAEPRPRERQRADPGRRAVDHRPRGRRRRLRRPQLLVRARQRREPRLRAGVRRGDRARPRHRPAVVHLGTPPQPARPRRRPGRRGDRAGDDVDRLRRTDHRTSGRHRSSSTSSPTRGAWRSTASRPRSRSGRRR